MQLNGYINTLSDTQLLIFLCFSIMGFLVIAINTAKTRKAKSSETWPYASGVIMHSMLSRSASMNDHSGNDLNTATFTSFETTDIRYCYIVHGRKYEGTKVSFANHFPRKMVSKYREGDTINVYYDPSNPEKSVLITGCPDRICTSFFAAFIMASPFFLIAAGAVIFG
jgi:hypothetical protein